MKALAEEFKAVLTDEKFEYKQGWKNKMRNLNAVTGANYRGVNAFRLAMVSLKEGYSDPRWATMAQIMDKKGRCHKEEKWHLKKGTKGTVVEYWIPYDLQKKVSITWDTYNNEIKNGRKETDFSINPKYFYVFNASCIEGISPFSKSEERKLLETAALVSTLSEKMEVPIEHKGDRAFYSPVKDRITLPEKGLFVSEQALNATAFHELAHSTGHESRLARFKGVGVGEEYAYEELVAEITSAFMADNISDLSEETMESHKGYLQSWISLLDAKPEVLGQAIKEGQKATYYMEEKAGLRETKEKITDVKLELTSLTIEDEPENTLEEIITIDSSQYSDYQIKQEVLEHAKESSLANLFKSELMQPGKAKEKGVDIEIE